MSGIGKKYAALRGRFPGEKEQSLPEMVERLVTLGAVSEPDSALAGRVANIVGVTPPDATPIPAAPAKAAQAPVATPEPVAAKPAAPAPVPAPAPAAPQALAPASSQRAPIATTPDEVEQAVTGVMGSGADSQLMSAVSGGGPLSDRISAKLPAITQADDEDELEDDFEDEDDDAFAGLSRGEDDLPDEPEEAESERLVVVEDESEPEPEPVPAAAPAGTGIVLMTDANIEDLLAGATGPTLADFRSSGLSDDWFDDPEFTSGRDSFDAILEGEAVDPGAPVVEVKVERVTQRIDATPPPVAAPEPVELIAASAPVEAPRAPEPAAPAQSADEDAADALLADLGLTSTPTPPKPTPAPVAAAAPAANKPKRWDKFDSVAHNDLEAVADELLKDIVESIRAKGIEPPPKLSRRMDPGAQKAKVEVVQMREKRDSPPSMRPIDTPTIVEAPRTESRASIPDSDARPVVRDTPIDSPARGRPRVADSEPEDSTPEDTFTETAAKAKKAGEGRTLVLSRADMDRAGRELVGVGQTSEWKVFVGALGVVLLASSLALYAVFVAFTGKF